MIVSEIYLICCLATVYSIVSCPAHSLGASSTVSGHRNNTSAVAGYIHTWYM